jgi:hypothetical protein
LSPNPDGLWHIFALAVQGVLASGGEDHLVVVWDLNRTKGSALSEGAPGSSNKGKLVVPPEVMFKHVGHRQGVSEVVLYGKM